MKKKLLVLMLGLAMILSFSLLTGCGSNEEAAPEEEAAAADPVAECAALIDAIYVQEYTDDTYAQCEAAKAAWDALTDEQKEQVEGEEASPDYFGRDTGDASKDDPLNQDDIGENELLVVSFGTSFNDSRAEDLQHRSSSITSMHVTARRSTTLIRLCRELQTTG